MPATCSTCKHWEGPQTSKCTHIDMGVTQRPDAPDTFVRIDAWAADDYNLDAQLLTGPSFGCVLHEAR
jgi:hypothetical protein